MHIYKSRYWLPAHALHCAPLNLHGYTGGDPLQPLNLAACAHVARCAAEAWATAAGSRESVHLSHVWCVQICLAKVRERGGERRKRSEWDDKGWGWDKKIRKRQNSVYRDNCYTRVPVHATSQYPYSRSSIAPRDMVYIFPWEIFTLSK